jgi:hypothetical protein
VKCPKCDGTGAVQVNTPNGRQDWSCGDCRATGELPDPITEAEAASAIRAVLMMSKRTGLIEEFGANGGMRVTMSCVLPVDVAEQIVELARANTIRL